MKPSREVICFWEFGFFFSSGLAGQRPTLEGKDHLKSSPTSSFKLILDVFMVKALGSWCVGSVWWLCCWTLAITLSICSELTLLCVNAKADLSSLLCFSCLIQSYLENTVSFIPATCFCTLSLSGLLSLSVQKKEQKRGEGESVGAEPWLQAKQKYKLRRKF